MDLYHVTTTHRLSDILSNGLRSGIYLCNTPQLINYYAECVRDEGFHPTIIEINLDRLIAEIGEAAMAVDNPSIAEPITTAIDKSEAEVMRCWNATEGTWRDSLAIVGSIKVNAVVPPALLTVRDDLVPEPRAPFGF